MIESRLIETKNNNNEGRRWSRFVKICGPKFAPLWAKSVIPLGSLVVWAPNPGEDYD